MLAKLLTLLSATKGATVAELRRHLSVPIPNEHTERLEAKAREHGV